jgi:cysteine desulfurase
VRTTYFDYNATTPLDPQVRAAMLPFLDEVWGNPSSVHHVGRRARALLDDARDRCAAVLGCKGSEVVFTSGGTESSNLAVFGTARLLRDRGRHLITSSIEHHAVLHCFDYLERKEGFTVTRLPVDSTGRVSVDDLRRALRPDTTLVSVMAANNETGTLQPVAELGALCRERGVLFHTDAVQWFGKEPFANVHQFNADLVSICAHKFHGPKGAGALFIRSPLHPDPVQFGGAHENERRAGTENLPAIIGFTEALERFVRVPEKGGHGLALPPLSPSPSPREERAGERRSDAAGFSSPLPNPLPAWAGRGSREQCPGAPVFDRNHLAPLTARLLAAVDNIEGAHFRGSREHRLANTVSFTVEGTDSIALMAALDMEGVCASSGSACSAGSLEPSHVMLALGAPAAEANALVRLSLGRASTAEEVEAVCALLPRVLRQVRRA